MNLNGQTALVLFSGGQDSTTALAWALERYALVETVGFDYGQKHHIEMVARLNVLAAFRQTFPQWAERLGTDHVLDLGVLGTISDTALTRDSAIQMTAQGLPNTFVPGRNLLFLTLSAALAYRRNLSILIGGMCETDYSGYPDCRNDSIQALQTAVSLGMGRDFIFEMPLMWLTKAQTWALAHTLGGPKLVALIVNESHTCYHGVREIKHLWGYGCGECPACALRSQGYARWVVAQSEPNEL